MICWWSDNYWHTTEELLQHEFQQLSEDIDCQRYWMPWNTASVPIVLQTLLQSPSIMATLLRDTLIAFKRDHSFNTFRQKRFTTNVLPLWSFPRSDNALSWAEYFIVYQFLYPKVCVGVVTAGLDDADRSVAINILDVAMDAFTGQQDRRKDSYNSKQNVFAWLFAPGLRRPCLLYTSPSPRD